MTKKILLVDDEPNLLAALQRALRKQFSIEIACGGAAGLAALKEAPTAYSVVVSDMRMPEMNGVQFLAQVKEVAPYVVRMMLTGNADQTTAIEAINHGNIFRFLNKPCTPERLADAVMAGIRQHELITAERELLETTLRGSVKVLTEILALADPRAFGFAEMLRDNMRRLAEAMNVKETWELEVAAMLSGIGIVTIPPEVLLRSREGRPLSSEEQEMFRRIPAVGGTLLAQIPRLQGVSRMLTCQSKCFDGSGLPDEPLAGGAIPLGARMLKVLWDLAELEGRGKTHSSSLEQMRARSGWYDPEILDRVAALEQILALAQAAPVKPSQAISFRQLRVGHILRADVQTRDGILIVATGNRVTPALMERLRNFLQLSGIREPVYVEA